MLDTTPVGPRPETKHSVAPLLMMVLVLAIVTSLALLLQPARAAAPPSPPPTAPTAPAVALIGDSITDQGRAVFAATLAPDVVDIQATGGKKMAEQLAVARDAAQRNPSAAVINLGTNDVLLDENPAVTRAALREMVDLFPPSTCIHLVTVNESFFAIFAEATVLNDRSRVVNEEIHKLAAERRYDIVDWAATVDRSNKSTPPVQLTWDSVHPNEVGKQVLADLYRDAVARGCS